MRNYQKRGKLWLAKALDDSYEPTDVIGGSGLQQYGGTIYEEWHQKLRGANGVRIYREMSDNDAVVGAILYAIESLIRGVTWTVNPADDSPGATQWKDFVETCQKDMSGSWDDLMSEVITMLVFGWSYFELVYKLRRGPDQEDPKLRSEYNDGKIGWRKIALRSQDTLRRWYFQPDGGLVGMEQQLLTGASACIPIDKALLFRTRVHKNNPEGYSLLRRAYRSWFIKKRLEEIEAIGIERDLTGLPVMEVPAELMVSSNSSDVTLRNELLDLVSQIRRDEREGVIVPSSQDREGNPTGYKFSLMTSGGTRAIPVGDTIKRYESRIAMSVLAEVIMLGVDGGGNRALGESKIDLFLLALNSFLGSIEAVLNRFAIPRLMQLNGAPREQWPNFTHSSLDEQTGFELADLVSKMAGANALDIDQPIKDHLREKAGFPAPEAVDGKVKPYSLPASQIDGLLQITTAIAMGSIPRDTGVNLIVASFGYSLEQAETLVASAGTPAFEAKLPETVGFEFGQDSPEPAQDDAEEEVPL